MWTNLINMLQTRQAEIWAALQEHIFLSLLSVVIATILALSLAIAFFNHRRLGNAFLQVAGIIQTIPSLAVLGVLIPLVGIGTLPATIALVLYALMPIYQNTYAGLIGIDPSLDEAADAFGLTYWFKLTHIQLPLAMPLILSGIRIAMVMVIGTATLAALIGAGGLGTLILLGIQTNNNAQLLIGAVLAALLALVFSWALNGLAKLPLKQGLMILLVLTGGILGYAGWQTVQARDQKIVIAGKLGPEPEILINMYKELIEEDQPQVKVQLKPNFGGTTFLYKALQRGDIDLYPEFTGTILQTISQHKVAVDHNPQAAYQKAKQVVARQDGFIYLKPMRYQNGYALAVRAETAKNQHLRTLSQLVKQAPRETAAFDPDFYQSADGYPGLKKAYGLNLMAVNMMEPSLKYDALKQGQVDVIDAYTTDPQLKVDNLVALEDDQHFFPPYQGAPLVRPELLAKFPRVKTSLNRLANRITTDEMIDMNYQVTVQHRKPAQVAHTYLVQHHLLKADR